jgi:hypothetical protein
MKKSKQDNPLGGWEKFLNPDNLRGNLLRASVFLSAYELMKSTILDRPYGFFSVTGDSSRYKDEVLSLYPGDRMQASCLWFKKMGAISDGDVASVQQLRKHRNAIAHELPKFLVDPQRHVDMQLLDIIHFLLDKVDRWWIREIEMPANPNFDNEDPSVVPDNEIYSRRMLAMDVILGIVYGKDEELRGAYKRLREGLK